MKDYKLQKTFEERKSEHERLIEKCPDRIGIIVQPYSVDDSNIPMIDKRKYAVYPDITMGTFSNIIRSRLKLDASKSLLFFINKKSLVQVSRSIADIYKEEKDDDGLLYMYYCGENTFG